MTTRPFRVTLVAALLYVMAAVTIVAAVATVIAGVATITGFTPAAVVGGLVVLAIGAGLALLARFEYRQAGGLLALDGAARLNTVGLLKIFLVLNLLNVVVSISAGGAAIAAALVPIAVIVASIVAVQTAGDSFGASTGESGNVEYILAKAVQLVAVLIIVTFLTFMLINLLPGGPEAAILGFGADDESIAQLQEDLNLDDPIPVRYARWLSDAIQGDLGESYVNGSTVSELLSARLPVTLALMAYSLFLALVVAVPFGIATAWKADTWFDKITGTISFGLLSVPNFIMATLLVYLFAINQTWFPATVKEGEENLYTLFLPALSLAVGQIAVFLRLLRTDMIATLQEDYIGVAKAKGMTNRRILFRHAFRPSSFSLLTVAAITVGNLIGGTVIIEQIFAINGIGKLIVTSIFTRDYLVVQGVVVVIAAGFVVINFAVDLIYAVLDPRIRHARAIA